MVLTYSAEVNLLIKEGAIRGTDLSISLHLEQLSEHNVKCIQQNWHRAAFCE